MSASLLASPLLVAAVLVALPRVAAAERRAFTRTYEYMTQTSGQTELEVDSEQRRSTFDDAAVQASRLQLSIVHGVTEHWQVALDHVLAQQTGPAPVDVQPLALAELRVRSRYRFAERGELPVDVAVATDVTKQVDASVYQVEGRLVAARDLGLLTVAAEPIVAVTFGGDVVGHELAVGWAAGATYAATSQLAVGAETWGRHVDGRDGIEAAAGPAVAWQPTDTLWVTVTAGFGLTDQSDSLAARAIVGVSL